MVEFCYDDECCRQAWILTYFGEPGDSNCGTCDVCANGNVSDKRGPSDPEFLITQKALSGVARSSRQFPNGEWEPIFGKGKIVAMLSGSKSQEVLKARLDQLSTHGLLKNEGSAYVFALLTEFEKAGLVVIRKKRPTPLMTMTRRGSDVMRGDHNFRINWPDAEKLAVGLSKSSGEKTIRTRFERTRIRRVSFQIPQDCPTRTFQRIRRSRSRCFRKYHTRIFHAPQAKNKNRCHASSRRRRSESRAISRSRFLLRFVITNRRNVRLGCLKAYEATGAIRQINPVHSKHLFDQIGYVHRTNPVGS